MSLVCVRSYLMVWEADWQRSLLAAAGIASCVDNPSLVLWVWYYTQAVGGVKLYVDHTQLEDAVAVLMGSMPDDLLETESPQLSSLCLHCKMPIPVDWDECWRCAPPPGEDPDARLAEGLDRESPAPVFLAIGISLLLAWVVIRHGLGLPYTVVLLSVVLATLAVFQQRRTDSEPDAGSITPDDDGTAPNPPWRSEVLERTAGRAWQTAVIGGMKFPPLLLYAIYVLLRLGWRRFNLSPTARLHYWGAIAVLLISSLFWGLVLLGFRF